MAKLKKKKPLKRSRSASAPKQQTSDDKKILEDARKNLKQCVDDEKDERALMQDDLRFATLDQWPDDIRKERENDVENGARPCLTIDKYSQYRTQIVNDMRQGKPGINVRPQDDSSDIETAKVLKGLVRNIEDQSNADIAYIAAGGSAVDIGLGFFRITTEYVDSESFDQEIFIRPIANTFSVYLSRHTMPDGSDAERGYIVESIPISKFREEYPKAKYKSGDFADIGDGLDYWHSEESITVIEEYKFETTMETLHFLADGSTISQADYDAWPDEAGQKPSIQQTRSTAKKQLKWHKMTGCEVLDRRDLPGKWIPIVEVIGRESNVDGQRILWGLVRPAKDSLRMYNYWASTITEKMALAPKTPFIGAVGQFATQADRWKKANRVNYATLEYDPIDINGNALPRPERQGATPVEAALLKQMQVIEHDVQTSLGMFKAATGESESQQSGRAILALQKESDTGTYHFGANLGVSIRHAGRIIVDLIPHYYDAKRIVRILGDDGEVQTVSLDPEQDEAHRKITTPDGIKSIYNPGVGKYDVSITTGPGYNTKRMEDQAMFVEMAKGATDPTSAAVMRYLSVRNSDSPGAQEASKMLKALLPPPVIAAMGTPGNQAMPPQAIQQIAQLTQGVQVLQQHVQELGQENMQLKAGAAVTQSKIAADHEGRMAEVQLEEKVEYERARLARDRARAELDQKRKDAELDAQYQREECEREREFLVWKARLEAQTKIEVAEIAASAKLQGDQIAAANQATADAAAPAKEEKAAKLPDIHVHVGGGKKTIKSPDGKVYTMDDAAQH